MIAFMARWRRVSISVFVIFWILLFHYESLRAFYLSPLAGRPLSKFPLLFPPAGWIMFYEVDNSWSTAEVYGRKKIGEPEFIDPHRIFETRFVGFDNIHRNIMVNALDGRRTADFCGFLKRKFPEYDAFIVFLAGYPELVPKGGRQKMYRPLYKC